MQRSLALAAFAALSLALAGCPSDDDDGPSCPQGQFDCGGVCRDTQTDPLACGICFRICAEGASCVTGECRCPAGQSECDGACVDLQADASNCGACGQACGLGTCTSGACLCEGTATDCLGDPACVDLQADTSNCGACGVRCLTRGICESGGCACPTGFPEECPSPTPTYCASFASTSDCGGCGIACAAGGICGGSPFACSCPAGEEVCGAVAGGSPGTCVNTATDEANCGDCGIRCAALATCSGSTCACPAGTEVCGNTSTSPGTCVDRQTDEANCGTCGTTCAAGSTCTTGVCCPSPRPVCGGTCCAGGDACCSGACPPAHSNGLGQSYFAGCDAPYAPSQTTEAAARLAADAWAPGTTLVGTTGCDAHCLGRQTGTSCAVWCYGTVSGVAGRVGINTINNSCVAACPNFGSPGWN